VAAAAQVSTGTRIESQHELEAGGVPHGTPSTSG
jgi:hypothetical protein